MGKPKQSLDDERLDIPGACAFIGGNRPINPSTLWRWIQQGKIRPPIRLGSKAVRFSKRRLAEDIERMADAAA